MTRNPVHENQCRWTGVKMRVSGLIVAAIWARSFVGCSRPDAVSNPPTPASRPAPSPAPAVSDARVGDVSASGTAPPREERQPLVPPSAMGVATSTGGASGIASSTAPTAGPVAVVILMLPGVGDAPDRPMAPRTYKLLLTADARTATIEVDGRTIGSAPVQHVRPAAGTPRVAARAPLLRNPPPRRVTVANDRSADGEQTAPSPFFDRDGMEVPVHANTLNPNGAPIID
jgi:hypothetical protein